MGAIYGLYRDYEGRVLEHCRDFTGAVRGLDGYIGIGWVHRA